MRSGFSCRPASGGSFSDQELEVAEAVVHDRAHGRREAVADVGERQERIPRVVRVVEDDPLGVHVAAAELLRRCGVEAADDDRPARRAHGRAGAVVGEHRELAVGAEVGRRPDGDRVADLGQHALEALVEVEAVLGRVEQRRALLRRRRRRWWGPRRPGRRVSSSTTSPGGTRPPRPTSVGAIVPVPVGVAVAPVICVVERFAALARNSATRPDSVTATPGTSAGSGGGLGGCR